MGLLNIIRRMALREKQSIREISRRTGLSRNTIAKYLNAGTIEPTFTVPERPSKLDPFADKLAAWLKTETGRSRKQRRTLKQLHADLVVLGLPAPTVGSPPLPVSGELSSRRLAAAYWGRNKVCSKSCAKLERTLNIHAARRIFPGSRRGLKPSDICCSVSQE